MRSTGLSRLLRMPVLTGWKALICGLVAAGLPTLVRAALGGEIAGCEFTPYLPFVFAAAILLRWWQAAAVAFSSVAIMGGLLDGSMLYQTQCFALAGGIFLAASGMMIVVAIMLRRMMVAMQHRGSDKPDGGIVFSLEKGQVWASWYDDGAPVRLGPHGRVSETMKDFIAQDKVAKRLMDQ